MQVIFLHKDGTLHVPPKVTHLFKCAECGKSFDSHRKISNHHDRGCKADVTSKEKKNDRDKIRYRTDDYKTQRHERSKQKKVCDAVTVSVHVISISVNLFSNDGGDDLHHVCDSIGL